jgi:excisionase family DNA binding protein
VSKQSPPPPSDQRSPYGPAAGDAPADEHTALGSIPQRHGDRGSSDGDPPQRSTRKKDRRPPALRPRVVSVTEAARYIARGRSTVYDLLSRGEIQAIKSGGRTLVILDTLDALLDRCPLVQVRAAHPEKAASQQETV